MRDLRRYIYVSNYVEREYYLRGFDDCYYSGIGGWTYGPVTDSALQYLEVSELKSLLESYFGSLDECRSPPSSGECPVHMGITISCDRTIYRCGGTSRALLIKDVDKYALLLTPGAFRSVARDRL